MRALERRIDRLEGLLMCRKVYFVVTAYKRQEDAKAEQRRRETEVAAEAARAERDARWAAQQAARAAEEAARPVEPPPAPRAKVPPPPLPEPKPPPWTYDPPPEMQIRPVSWRRSEPYDDGSEDNYGKCIVDYDPLAQADDDYDDDS